VIHYEEALYQVYGPLPLPYTFTRFCIWLLLPKVGDTENARMETGRLNFNSRLEFWTKQQD